MEIIIAMVIAFFAGAFVRKPFCLPKREEETPKAEAAETKEDKRYWTQVENLLHAGEQGYRQKPLDE